MENNWKEVQLIEVLETLESGSRPKGGVRGILEGIPSIGAEHLNNTGCFDFSNIKYVPKSFADGMNRGKIEVGDILIVKDGATTGKTSFVDSSFPYQKAFVNEHVFICRPTKMIEPKFVYWFLKSKEGNSRIMENFKGSAQGGINQSFASNTLVPIAPLAEQQRIVAKLDELMEKIDRSRARLERIPKILKRFRQSIISAAVSGRLTEKWRTDNPNTKSAKELINDLLQSRINNNPKAKLSHKEVRSDDQIPDRWTWTPLLNIAEVIGGVTKGRKFNGKKTIHLPYLRVANVQDGYLDLDEIKMIEVLPEDFEKYKLIKDDILFTEGGDRDKLGRGTVWNNEITNCIHQNHIFRARAFSNYVLAGYVSLYTKSDNARSYFFDNASQTVNLASINLTTLANVPIAIPPFQEQQEILRIVNQLFGLADKIEARYKRGKHQFEKLPESLLAKAFRGQLVPQDAIDEPANLILERIQLYKSKDASAASRRHLSPTKKKSTTKGKAFSDILSFLESTKSVASQRDILDNVNIQPAEYLISMSDLIERGKVKKSTDGLKVLYSITK